MAHGWYIANDPRLWTNQQVRQFVAQGKILPHTMLRRSDSAQALPASRIKGLLPESAAEPSLQALDQALASADSSPAASDLEKPSGGTASSALLHRQDPFLRLERAGGVAYLALLLRPELYRHLWSTVATAIAVLVAIMVVVLITHQWLVSIMLMVGPVISNIVVAVVCALIAGAVMFRIPFAVGSAALHREARPATEEWPIGPVGVQGGLLLALIVILPANLGYYLHAAFAALLLLLGWSAMALCMVSIMEARGAGLG